MRVACYARVSTRDKDQHPETPRLRLRQFVSQHPDWHVAQTYVDQADVSEESPRPAWTQLQADITTNRGLIPPFDCVVVGNLQQAFTSLQTMSATLFQWSLRDITFLSVEEALDTATPVIRTAVNMLASAFEWGDTRFPPPSDHAAAEG